MESMERARLDKRRQFFTFGVILCVGLSGILYSYDIGVIAGALSFIRHTIPMTDSELGLIVGAVLGGGLRDLNYWPPGRSLWA